MVPGCVVAAMLAAPALAAPPAPDLRAGGGFAGLFPAAEVSLRTPVAPTVDLEARYETVVGVSHDVGLTGRWYRDAWSLGLSAANGFFGVEDLAGISPHRAPLGGGLTTALLGAHHHETARGHRVRVEVGLTARWTHVDDVDAGTVDRVFDPTLHHVHAEVAVDWAGGLFLRGRAVVPVQADLKVIGYLPVVSVGYRWSL